MDTSTREERVRVKPPCFLIRGRAEGHRHPTARLPNSHPLLMARRGNRSIRQQVSEKVLASEDIHEKAIQRVRKELGPDAITLDSRANIKKLVGDMQQDIQKNRTNRPEGRRWARFSNVLIIIFKIVDVAIQHQPQVAATITGIGEPF